MIQGISVLEKERTADKYIQRKLQTVTVSRHLKCFDVDIFFFFAFLEITTT